MAPAHLPCLRPCVDVDVVARESGDDAEERKEVAHAGAGDEHDVRAGGVAAERCRALHCRRGSGCGRGRFA